MDYRLWEAFPKYVCQSGRHHKMPTVINNKHIYIMSEWRTAQNANCKKKHTFILSQNGGQHNMPTVKKNHTFILSQNGGQHNMPTVINNKHTL